MNTRLQVEHPGDGARHRARSRARDGARRAGRDARLRAERPRVARRGDRVPRLRRGSVERASCRRRASSRASSSPSGPGVRDDGGAYPGCTISSFYDPLISKLSVWAPTRERAVDADAPRARPSTSSRASGRTSRSTRSSSRTRSSSAGDTTPASSSATGTSSSATRVKAERRDAVAVAIAVAAARMERATGATQASEGESRSRLSPWVAHHRARRWA